jgi:hypothetical protein
MGEQAVRPLNQQHKAELVPGSCPQRCRLPSGDRIRKPAGLGLA